MKTTLKLAALFSAAGLPTALALEVFGTHVPLPVDAGTLFGTFASALVLLIAFSDYGAQRKGAAVALSGGHSAFTVKRSHKAAHPLAA